MREHDKVHLDPEGAGNISAPGDIHHEENILGVQDTYHDGIKDSAEEIIQHLLFHQSMARTPEELDRIERYIEIVREYEEERMLYESDPFERALSIVMELMITNRMDPWDIDLIRFSTVFMDRLKEEKLIDLPTVGHIIHLAWKILRKKSDMSLIQAQDPVEDEADIYDDIIPDWYSVEDETYDVAKRIASSEPPIKPIRTRPPSPRPVSLMELINAFEKAKGEIERAERRRRNKDKMKISREEVNGLLSRTLHEDDIRRDMEIVMEKILSMNMPRVDFRKLVSDVPERTDRVAMFVTLLHLRKHGYIELEQRNIVRSPLYIVPINRTDDSNDGS